MNPVIAKLYEKTADAVLVQKWFKPVFPAGMEERHGDSALAYLYIMHRDKAEDLLNEARRLEAEEKKDK